MHSLHLHFDRLPKGSAYLAAAAWFSFFAPPVFCQVAAPFRARVVAPSATVHSGPGENFYATDTLAEGDAIDIYRQQANGWCAIRPPEGSFSWIFGRHLKLNAGAGPESGDDSVSVAEIDKPDVASRIGSRQSPQRNAVQVRLKKGEVVHILGREEIDGQLWYKISPPAGEFRWIHISQVRRTGPLRDDGTSRPQSEVGNSPSAASHGDSASHDPGVVDAAAVASPFAADQSIQPAQATENAKLSPSPFSDAPPLLPSATATPADTAPPAAKTEYVWRAAPTLPAMGNVPAAANAPAVAPVMQPFMTAGPSSTTTSATTSAAPSVVSPTPVAAAAPAPSATTLLTEQPFATQSTIAPAGPPAQSLTELELRLSRMVAEPPIAWNIESLQADAKKLLTTAPSPAERASIQATIAKLDRFAAIARRYQGARGANGAPGTAPDITPITGVTLADGTHFDAVGVLRPVASRRPGAPPFALVNERGQVLSFVTPSAGVNLQPYVGHRIGVAGNRGYIPEFQRVHVVAGKAAPVTDRVVR